MLNLLIKDFRLMFGKRTSLARRITTALVVVVLVGCFVALEVFIFQGVLTKISAIEGASEAFLSVFLFIITVLLTVFGVFQAKKLFFDPLDVELLSVRPVSNGQIIASKMVMLFLVHYAASFVFSYPLFAAYGNMQGFSPMYYYKALFYPVASFLFETGLSLVFVYPAYLASRYLKNKPIAKLVMAIVVMAVLTYAYSVALSLFTSLVAQNNVMALFTQENVDVMIAFREYAVPVNFLLDIFIGKSARAFLIYLLIGSGVFILGVSITVFAYNYVRNVSFTAPPKKAVKTESVLSAKKALVKKELILIFKDSDYIFSFTGLLVVQPFLLSLVINAMNAVFNSGTIMYYTSFLPGFVPAVDIFFVMIFSTTIAQGASAYISMEKRTVKNMKTMPVPVRDQLFIKVAIPFLLSATSLVISLLALVISGILKPTTTLFALLFAAISLAAYDLASLIEELSIRHAKPRKTFTSSMYSYALPFVFAIIVILFSYLGVNLYLCYLIALAAVLLAVAPIALCVYKKTDSLFLDLEAVN